MERDSWISETSCPKCGSADEIANEETKVLAFQKLLNQCKQLTR